MIKSVEQNKWCSISRTKCIRSFKRAHFTVFDAWKCSNLGSIFFCEQEVNFLISLPSRNQIKNYFCESKLVDIHIAQAELLKRHCSKNDTKSNVHTLSFLN